MFSETFEEFKKRINKEIKDKGLKFPDKEYYALKARIHYRKDLQERVTCPTCGFTITIKTLRKGHKCTSAFLPNLKSEENDLKV